MLPKAIQTNVSNYYIDMSFLWSLRKPSALTEHLFQLEIASLLLDTKRKSYLLHGKWDMTQAHWGFIGPRAHLPSSQELNPSPQHACVTMRHACAHTWGLALYRSLNSYSERPQQWWPEGIKEWSFSLYLSQVTFPVFPRFNHTWQASSLPWPLKEAPKATWWSVTSISAASHTYTNRNMAAFYEMYP